MPGPIGRPRTCQPGPRARRGFTLVELLVVIAIIGILIALLLPAVQAAREAGRRAQCANNLKQINLGVQNYVDVNKILPPGALWFVAPTYNGSGFGTILLHLLPFLEQQTVYDRFDFTQSTTDFQYVPGSTTLIGSAIIPTYVCPTDDAPSIIPSTGMSSQNYAASSGANALIDNPAMPCANNWNSFALGPYGVANTFAGPFYRQGVPVKLNQITDGLSKTIFFGETRPQCATHVSNGWAVSNDSQGLCSTIIPINYDTCSQTAANGCNNWANWNTSLGFRSAHAGGCHFGFGDGSVFFLSDEIDQQTYQYLGSKADGMTVSIPQ